MQPDLSKSVKSAKESVNSPEFHQMADGMKKAMNEFESASSYIAPIREACVSAWKATTRLVRRHPVESSLVGAGLGLLAAYMLMPSRSRSSRKSSSVKTT